MKIINYGLLLIAALALSFTSCKKEKNNPPAGGGGGGSGSSEYMVPSSGNNSITTCTGVIKDHAGDGDYEDNINGYTIINPSMTGHDVELSFTSFALEDCCDFVTIFDGAGTDGAELFSGNGTTIPPTITATNGPLTIRHTSDVSITNSGFVANISCVPGSSSDTFDCISGNCVNVGSGGTYATQGDCEANCGGSTDGYNCVSGNCQFVSSGAQFGTLADCQNNCGGSADCCDCTGVGFACDVCCDGEFDMLGESWDTWVQLFEQSGCNCE